MRDSRSFSNEVLPPSRVVWDGLGHLLGMNSERLAGLGLEPMLTTSELAEYLGVHVQAIYDLRADGRGPAGIRVGRELRYRISMFAAGSTGCTNQKRRRSPGQMNSDGRPAAPADRQFRRDHC